MAVQRSTKISRCWAPSPAMLRPLTAKTFPLPQYMSQQPYHTGPELLLQVRPEDIVHKVDFCFVPPSDEISFSVG